MTRLLALVLSLCAALPLPGAALDRLQAGGLEMTQSASAPTVALSSSPGPTTAAQQSGAGASLNAAHWNVEPRITFYGPGHYGRPMACGGPLTTRTVGVATWMFPCGTKIAFRYQGRTIVAPVVDRGPAHWTGFRFDLTGRACVNLVASQGACWTIRNVQWRVVPG